MTDRQIWVRWAQSLGCDETDAELLAAFMHNQPAADADRLCDLFLQRATLRREDM